MPPRQVGPYQILSVLGRGGIGTVYRALDSRSGALVAVKVLGPIDPVTSRRLAREYDVLRSLDHPNVVRVHAAGVADGHAFLTMELVEGLDLRTYLSPTLDAPARLGPEPADRDPPTEPGEDAGPAAARALAAMLDEPETEEARSAPGADALPAMATAAPPLDPGSLVALNHPARLARLRGALAQVADALAYVHGKGFVHRDLKPSNIMIDDRRRARLMDFGLVKTAGEAEEPLTAGTEAGRIVGTYRYMSPEQAQGREVDARSDLYSLGVILYEFLAGGPPFTATDPVELWREILHSVPPPLAGRNPGAPAELCALSVRLLDKEPRRRPDAAAEVAKILRG